ncbi:hypothetical protein HK414_16960 [Ramlibacter terrae]|uniref:Uncharacterized protein n=1 Tax=Ramlibacter terrae TaxID=2732511 RepID=A0ABX6P3W6_9BURK|nr:hypothetical protein HK414_16960 [Ramlibacter terrae]
MLLGLGLQLREGAGRAFARGAGVLLLAGGALRVVGAAGAAAVPMDWWVLLMVGL